MRPEGRSRACAVGCIGTVLLLALVGYAYWFLEVRLTESPAAKAAIEERYAEELAWLREVGRGSGDYDRKPTSSLTEEARERGYFGPEVLQVVVYERVSPGARQGSVIVEASPLASWNITAWPSEPDTALALLRRKDGRDYVEYIALFLDEQGKEIEISMVVELDSLVTEE